MGNSKKSGWIKSVELVLLAKLPAALLVVLFSLPFNINASIASGSKNIFCPSVKTIDRKNGDDTFRPLQINQSSFCAFDFSGFDAGVLSKSNTTGQTSVYSFFGFANSQHISAIANQFANIRAPPLS